VTTAGQRHDSVAFTAVMTDISIIRRLRRATSDQA